MSEPSPARRPLPVRAIAPLYLAVGMVAVSAALVGSEPAMVAVQYAVGVAALAGLVHLAITYARARAFAAREER